MSAREQFIVSVCNQMKEVWESTTSIDRKWNVCHVSYCLGKACRRQPDWFKDNESLILPLFEKRRLLHDKWLVTGLEHDKEVC